MSDPRPPVSDPRLTGLQQLLHVMDRLRDPGGCPWDRAQDRATLRSFLLEETFELLEALDRGDPAAVREELGDVLFQVVFHARIAEEEGAYDLGEVARGIADKLRRRHPHVFEGARADTPDEVVVQWEEHKKREGRRSVMDGLPRALPALLLAERTQDKAARVGFDWQDAAGPLGKVREEIGELEEQLAQGALADPRRVAAELGDLLFSVVNLARHLNVTAEDALRETTRRFQSRFRRMEAARPDLRGLPLEELDRLWEEAKAAEQAAEGRP